MAGGVAATDDDNRSRCALTNLGLGGRVVDALALELVEAGRVESPVVRATGDDDRSAGDLGAVGQPDDEVSAVLA